jgi:hypothetical protein
MPADISTYPKLAIQWLNLPALPLRQAGQALCFYQNLCLVDSETLRNRQLLRPTYRRAQA